jgi:hypothetical protein
LATAAPLRVACLLEARRRRHRRCRAEATRRAMRRGRRRIILQARSLFMTQLLLRARWAAGAAAPPAVVASVAAPV